MLREAVGGEADRQPEDVGRRQRGDAAQHALDRVHVRYVDVLALVDLGRLDPKTLLGLLDLGQELVVDGPHRGALRRCLLVLREVHRARVAAKARQQLVDGVEARFFSLGSSRRPRQPSSRRWGSEGVVPAAARHASRRAGCCRPWLLWQQALLLQVSGAAGSLLFDKCSAQLN